MKTSSPSEQPLLHNRTKQAKPQNYNLLKHRSGYSSSPPNLLHYTDVYFPPHRMPQDCCFHSHPHSETISEILWNGIKIWMAWRRWYNASWSVPRVQDICLYCNKKRIVVAKMLTWMYRKSISSSSNLNSIENTYHQIYLILFFIPLRIVSYSPSGSGSASAFIWYISNAGCVTFSFQIIRKLVKRMRQLVKLSGF